MFGKKKVEPKSQSPFDRFTRAVFHRRQGSSYSYNYSQKNNWVEWIKLRTSGFCVELDGKKLYECLEIETDHFSKERYKVMWLPEADLKFPKLCAGVNND